MNLKERTCCFFGHRKIEVTDELVCRLNDTLEGLIVENKIDTFLFGSKSEFDKLCLKVVTKLKKKYPHIKRIYVRAEFPYISDSYRSYLLERYEDTYFPESILRAGRAVYVERNFEMIRNSQYCLVYYDEANAPVKRKSGTKIALDHAVKRNKEIIIFE